MKKAIIAMALTMVLIAGTAQALNLWMSNSIFEGMTLPAGFKGYTGQQISWGTFDNETYTLETSIDGEASKFFKHLEKTAEIGPGRENNYQYLLYLRIPKKTEPGNYSFTFCGKITLGWLGLASCKSAILEVV